MMDLFYSLDGIQQMFWGCAIIGSVVFVVQFVLTFIGLDSTDVDINADLGDGDTLGVGGPLSLFTIKNLIAFVVGFGWGGVCLNGVFQSKILLTFAAFIVGVAFVMLFAIIYKQTKRLESDGTFQINDCVGVIADVYLRIPANKSGKGKVQVSINGSVHELEAMTNDDDIASGMKVKITEIIGNDTVLVEKE